MLIVDPHTQTLIVRKAGLAGSTPIACGGGSISDLFAERDRAGAMAVFTLGPLLGSAHVSHLTSDILMLSG